MVWDCCVCMMEMEALLAVELCFGALANCLVLTVFCRRPALLTIANRFIVNLAVVNILACLLQLPIYIADLSPPPSTYSPGLRSLQEFSLHWTASIVPLSVLLIAIDQYLAVTDPLHYHFNINGLKSGCLIAFAWIISLTIAVASVVVPEFHRGNGLLNDQRETSGDWTSFSFSLAVVLISFVVPFFLICLIYTKICAAATDNAKRAKLDLGHFPEELEPSRQDSFPQIMPILTVTRPSPPRNDEIDLQEQKPFLPRNHSFSSPKCIFDAVPRRHSSVPTSPEMKSPSISSSSSRTTSSRNSSLRLSIRSTSSSLVSSLRHRLSNAGFFRQKERVRATKVSTLVVVMALVSWLPFFIVFLLENRFIVPDIVIGLANALFHSSTLISPALFAFRNRKIRKELRKMLCLTKSATDFRRKNLLLTLKQRAIGVVLKIKPNNRDSF